MPDAAGRPLVTFAEARVLVALLERRTPREVATLIGSSLSTIRTHIKHLQTKSDTHSLAALVLWGLDELSFGHLQEALRTDSDWLDRAERLLTNR